MRLDNQMIKDRYADWFAQGRIFCEPVLYGQLQLKRILCFL